MTFLNAALVAGVFALAIPIIIHLFHKSRFKIVKWGAMHLLEAVLRTNQRRIKIEQWLLLAIRCAIPAILALCMARVPTRPALGEDLFCFSSSSGRVLTMRSCAAPRFIRKSASTADRPRPLNEP